MMRSLRASLNLNEYTVQGFSRVNAKHHRDVGHF